MLLGTVIGVLIIPGLYYLFAVMPGDRKLLPDEKDNPLSNVNTGFETTFQLRSAKAPRKPPEAGTQTGL
jgi:hypothetical protein